MPPEKDWRAPPDEAGDDALQYSDIAHGVASVDATWLGIAVIGPGVIGPYQMVCRRDGLLNGHTLLIQQRTEIQYRDCDLIVVEIDGLEIHEPMGCCCRRILGVCSGGPSRATGAAMSYALGMIVRRWH